MLPMLILGLVLAFLLVLVLRWASAADPKALLRLLLWTVGGVLLATFVFLAVSGRLAWAAAALAALVPWLLRALRLAAFGPGLARLLRALGMMGGGLGGLGGPGGGSGRAGPDPDDVSTVETDFLRMSLNHATGAMSGTVRAGTFAGRRLDDLDRAEVAALRGEVRDDPESLRVLDAWIERARPDWASDGTGEGAQGTGGGSGGGSGGGGAMTRAEALAILGLEKGADADAVKAAHRRLIALVHPDRGGSPYLAARLNEARDLLLVTQPNRPISSSHFAKRPPVGTARSPRCEPAPSPARGQKLTETQPAPRHANILRFLLTSVF